MLYKISKKQIKAFKQTKNRSIKISIYKKQFYTAILEINKFRQIWKNWKNKKMNTTQFQKKIKS